MSATTPGAEADERWMGVALEEARSAAAKGEVPVGCVVVRAGVEISRAHNLRETTGDPTAHAELLAIRAAAEALGDWRLDDAEVFVTLEPCAMCAGALVLARVSRVVYGCADPKAGAIETLYAIGSDGRLNHRFAQRGGVRAQECARELQAFFAALRAQGKK